MPTAPPFRRPSAALLVLAGAVVAAVVGTGLLIVADPTWSAAELQVVATVNGAHNPVLDGIARFFNALFGPGGATLVALLVVAVVLLLTRSWAAALRSGIVLGFAWALAELIKPVVQRPRPDPAALSHLIVADPLSDSYPSGHTAIAAAAACAIVLALAGRRARMITGACAIVLVLLTGWSRVYLGVHYPTDVLASVVVVPALALLAHGILSRVRVFAVAPLIGGGA